MSSWVQVPQELIKFRLKRFLAAEERQLKSSRAVLLLFDFWKVVILKAFLLLFCFAVFLFECVDLSQPTNSKDERARISHRASTTSSSTFLDGG